ncbi:hypothetical protein [uncultured Imperialibacter sp.]|uniref:hypothetical protein n=1 Tax=uncultured Imperialibacter sp. TaxID=1672639 RepID=UPI0030DD07BE|tara:strand:- start:1649 stop:2029 length:381 start_codon:yes stop_codon:yes gene_type:complete
MAEELKFDPIGRLTIEEVQVWMDGGTVTVITQDTGINNYEIEFVQKATLDRRGNSPFPGSLLLDKQEVEIRSELESKIMSAVKNASWGQKINETEKRLQLQIIVDCIDFIASDNYIEISKKVGRLN